MELVVKMKFVLQKNKIKVKEINDRNLMNKKNENKKSGRKINAIFKNPLLKRFSSDLSKKKNNVSYINFVPNIISFSSGFCSLFFIFLFFFVFIMKTYSVPNRSRKKKRDKTMYSQNNNEMCILISAIQ